VWRLLIDTATNSNKLSREDNPAKQLAALKEECQNALQETARNRKKLYDYENKHGANPFFIGLYKKLYEMSKSQNEILDSIFNKHQAEIAEYLRVNLFQIK
jgi:excinuclease UvrABC helicase subunit UvrB